MHTWSNTSTTHCSSVRNCNGSNDGEHAEEHVDGRGGGKFHDVGGVLIVLGV